MYPLLYPQKVSPLPSPILPEHTLITQVPTPFSPLLHTWAAFGVIWHISDVGGEARMPLPSVAASPHSTSWRLSTLSSFKLSSPLPGERLLSRGPFLRSLALCILPTLWTLLLPTFLKAPQESVCLNLAPLPIFSE